MTLSPGTRLGPYEIAAPIGAGGMGEVYRASDTRLSRDVAIKVLPSEFAQNAQLRARFEREAKAISSLNHPNICTLFDVGTHDGIEYLVMELLDGEPLSDRIARGPLNPADALRYGIEIADALDRAHRGGIVHRDLKPGNVIITRSGAKLLDFGLAKPRDVITAVPEDAATAHMTSQKSLTAEGTIVGTFQYMSPEQLERNEADARSDIFAFGAVLYEMLTGRRAFEGKSRASTIAQILASDPPPVSSVRPMTPASLDRVVRTCLAKDPNDRFQTSHDVMLALQWIRDEVTSPASAAAPALGGRRPRANVLPWLIAAAMAAVAAGSVVWALRSGVAPERSLSANIDPPEGAVFLTIGDYAGAPVVSPDGRSIAFVALTTDVRRMIWVRDLITGDAHQLEGTVDASFPFWSPDSRSIGFFAGGKLKTVEATGGAPVTLANVGDGRGGAWTAADVIVYTPDTREGLFRIPASGGAPVRLTKPSGTFTTHRWPVALPGSDTVLYLAASHNAPQSPETSIRAIGLDGRNDRTVLQTLANVTYAGGRLLYLRDYVLYAQPFDTKRAALTGVPRVLAKNIRFDLPTWRGAFDASSNGILIFQAGGAVTGSHLTWFDRTGKQLGYLGDRAPFYDVTLSPDASRAAIAIGDPHADIWIADAASGRRTRLTFEAQASVVPVWSPDGSEVFYSSGDAPTHPTAVYRRPSTGGLPRLVANTNKHVVVGGVTPDSKYVVATVGVQNDATIQVLPADGGAPPRRVDTGPGLAYEAHLSPDGRWIAYTGNETGREEIYVVPFAGAGKWQISSSGGHISRWSRDGKHIYYVTPNGELTEADVVASASTFAITAVRPLFRVQVNPTTDDGYDVATDGRFLVNTADNDSRPFTLVTNWPSRVQRGDSSLRSE